MLKKKQQKKITEPPGEREGDRFDSWLGARLPHAKGEGLSEILVSNKVDEVERVGSFQAAVLHYVRLIQPCRASGVVKIMAEEWMKKKGEVLNSGQAYAAITKLRERGLLTAIKGGRGFTDYQITHEGELALGAAVAAILAIRDLEGSTL